MRVHDGKVSLSLAPGQSTLLILGADLPQAQEEAPFAARVPFAPEWDIALAEAGHEGEFTPLARSSALADIAEAEEYASFAGWMRYRAHFTLSEEEAGKIRALSLGEVGMTARVRVNEKELGERICTPYLFDVSGRFDCGGEHHGDCRRQYAGGRCARSLFYVFANSAFGLARAGGMDLLEQKSAQGERVSVLALRI